MIWIVFAAMTAAALLCILWPLVWPRGAPATQPSDLSFYRDHLAELEQDIARGLLPEDESRGARAELGRRLLAAAERGSTPDMSPVRRPRLVAAAVAACFVPIAAIALYLYVGHPAEPDEPLAARIDADHELAAAVAKVEAHLAAHPDDGRGFEIIAPIYFRSGQYQAAANAYGNVIRLLGSSAERQASYGQALVMAADGIVTANAREAFEAALHDDPALPQARFFLGLAALQEGDRNRARDIWARLLGDAPPNAPWIHLVTQHLAALDTMPAIPAQEAPAAPAAGGPAAGQPAAGAPAAGAPSMAASIAAMPPEQRALAIRGMVDGLAARLAQNGRDPDGWLRLVRAYTVLGDPEKARQALADARRVLKDDDQAISRLDGLAHELGLEG